MQMRFMYARVSPAVAPRDILARGAVMFDTDHPGVFSLACPLHRAKDGIACVVRILDNDSAGIQRILQRGADGVNRSSTAFAHALCAVECEGRRRLHVAIEKVRHIHRGNRRVVAERRGEQVAVGIVGAILHERGANPVSGAAVHLSFDDHGG